MKAKYIWITIVLLLLLVFFRGCCGYRYVKVVYKVVDEQGNPIKGATVNNHYFTGGGLAQTPTKDYYRGGTTNKDGFFSYRDILAGVATISVGAKKDGYYTSYDGVGFWEYNKKWTNKSQPKTIILKKKIKPIKMYAKHVNLRFPIKRGKIDYDLVEGEFVAPYGNGKTADLTFHVVSDRDHNHLQNITFSNAGDGIQPYFVKSRSSLSAGYNAPSSGYLSSWKEADDLGYKEFTQQGHQADERLRGTTNYYFKVRSQQDGTAMYGYCSMLFWGVYPDIHFNYFLNPDRTTNIEYGGSYFPRPAKVETFYPPDIPN